jgi:hypothetical protein
MEKWLATVNEKNTTLFEVSAHIPLIFFHIYMSADAS